MATVHLTLKDWNARRLQDEHRRRALQRLYERRQAVEHLIRSLERYQLSGTGKRAARFSAGSMCS
jgi:hypothetical protein